MKLSLFLSILVLGLGIASPVAEAQSCPYTVSITSYGSSCTNLVTPPSLVGFPPSGGTCQVQFFHLVPPASASLTNRWFLIGLSPASLPLPGGGCLLLPPDTALIGISIYVQGIDRRFDAIAGTQHFETSNGLRLDVQ
jgi:hypothetical protein